ncbi:hypothetical protein PLICRDRAFT_526508 [Plicaturopsis crispa FD-325 SS-3]|nr:hypothetical protein PLICRDRAFT_526508 [Plicaturopsis crispa FD-325 SS-3]
MHAELGLIETNSRQPLPYHTQRYASAPRRKKNDKSASVRRVVLFLTPHPIRKYSRKRSPIRLRPGPYDPSTMSIAVFARLLLMSVVQTFDRFTPEPNPYSFTLDDIAHLLDEVHPILEDHLPPDIPPDLYISPPATSTLPLIYPPTATLELISSPPVSWYILFAILLSTVLSIYVAVRVLSSFWTRRQSPPEASASKSDEGENRMESVSTAEQLAELRELLANSTALNDLNHTSATSLLSVVLVNVQDGHQSLALLTQRRIAELQDQLTASAALSVKTADEVHKREVLSARLHITDLHTQLAASTALNVKRTEAHERDILAERQHTADLQVLHAQFTASAELGASKAEDAHRRELLSATRHIEDLKVQLAASVSEKQALHTQVAASTELGIKHAEDAHRCNVLSAAQLDDLKVQLAASVSDHQDTKTALDSRDAEAVAMRQHILELQAQLGASKEVQHQQNLEVLSARRKIDELEDLLDVSRELDVKHTEEAHRREILTVRQHATDIQNLQAQLVASTKLRIKEAEDVRARGIITTNEHVADLRAQLVASAVLDTKNAEDAQRLATMNAQHQVQIMELQHQLVASKARNRAASKSARVRYGQVLDAREAIVGTLGGKLRMRGKKLTKLRSTVSSLQATIAELQEAAKTVTIEPLVVSPAVCAVESSGVEEVTASAHIESQDPTMAATPAVRRKATAVDLIKGGANTPSRLATVEFEDSQGTLAGGNSAAAYFPLPVNLERFLEPKRRSKASPLPSAQTAGETKEFEEAMPCYPCDSSESLGDTDGRLALHGYFPEVSESSFVKGLQVDDFRASSPCNASSARAIIGVESDDSMAEYLPPFEDEQVSTDEPLEGEPCF